MNILLTKLLAQQRTPELVDDQLVPTILAWIPDVLQRMVLPIIGGNAEAIQLSAFDSTVVSHGSKKPTCVLFHFLFDGFLNNSERHNQQSLAWEVSNSEDKRPVEFWGGVMGGLYRQTEQTRPPRYVSKPHEVPGDVIVLFEIGTRFNFLPEFDITHDKEVIDDTYLKLFQVRFGKRVIQLEPQENDLDPMWVPFPITTILVDDDYFEDYPYQLYDSSQYRKILKRAGFVDKWVFYPNIKETRKRRNILSGPEYVQCCLDCPYDYCTNESQCDGVTDLDDFQMYYVYWQMLREKDKVFEVMYQYNNWSEHKGGQIYHTILETTTRQEAHAMLFFTEVPSLELLNFFQERDFNVGYVNEWFMNNIWNDDEHKLAILQHHSNRHFLHFREDFLGPACYNCVGRMCDCESDMDPGVEICDNCGEEYCSCDESEK